MSRQAIRPLAVVALACMATFALLAGWSRLTPVASWEHELSRILVRPPEPMASLVATLNLAGELIVWVPLVASLSIAALLLRQVVAAGLLALTIGSDIAAALTKVLVERSRPEGALVGHLLGDESFAFPSGHVVRATALIAVLAWLLTPAAWRPPVALASALGASILAGLAMGYARVAAGAHWPTDALGGLLLGLGWFGLSGWLLLRRHTAREV